MAPYAYRPTSAVRYARPSALSTEEIGVILATLQQELHDLLTQIKLAKSPWSLLLFVLSPARRGRQSQQVAHMRARTQVIIEQMRTLKEQQVALLFVDCWREEVARLPNACLLGRQERENAGQESGEAPLTPTTSHASS